MAQIAADVIADAEIPTVSSTGHTPQVSPVAVSVAQGAVRHIAVDTKKASGVTVIPPILRDRLEPLRLVPVGDSVIFDGTEYAESPEQLIPRGVRSKHFLRQSDLTRSLETEQKAIHSTIDVDETDTLGIGAGIDYIASVVETLPTDPAVEQVDTWAQETRAGFMGYLEKLTGLWKKESKTVGKKLFEAADGYSHRFFNLLHVKEAEHPVLAAKITRIILAMTISLTLVFVIFGLALHLQKQIVARAHEEAGKQQPRSGAAANGGGEQLFFAMPYPHVREDGHIVIVE